MKHFKLLMLLTFAGFAAVQTGCAAVAGGAAGYAIGKHCSVHQRHCH